MTDNNAQNADLSALKIHRDHSKPPGRWKRWFHLLWLLIPVVLYFGYQIAVQKATPSKKVRVGTVRMITGTDAVAELVATGYVVAQVKAAVASKATGRLRLLNVEEGDGMLENEIIAELENDDIRAALDIARANLKLAEADSTAAGLDFRRQEMLLKSGHTTESVLEQATAGYYRALAYVEAMAAGVTAAEVDLDNTYIRAPFDGTVLTKHADVGEMVTPFASASSSKGAVVTMADMSSLEVEADVSESNIHKVQVGAPCEIILDAYPRQVYTGAVKKIVPTADRARATVMTKIAFDAIDDRVLPEMSARVNFLPETDAEQEEIEPVMIVDNDAITQRNGRTVVFILANDLAQETQVQTGRQLGDVTEVVSGLDVGQQVILSPAGGLKSGEKMEITN
ncbi:MAG: efflux RND transporter periplasmic adaptor subunit [FCB group bacterium]|nr:efflux RND transporter periplasmic adaptor subunit [FCB group bacterium]